MTKKKKLLLVTGAGASIDFGMPSVKEAGEIINTMAQERFPLADETGTNLYKHIEQMIKGYWCKSVPKYLRRDPQFEDILTISELVSAYPAGAYTSPLGALISVKELPDVMFARCRSKVDQHQISHFTEDALNALLNEIRDRYNSTPPNLARLQSFVTTLQNTFELAVVTVNYDDILYRALSEIETGFDPDTRHFDEQRIYGRRGWPCILHLHGSVHFNMPTPPQPGDDLHGILWEPNIGIVNFRDALAGAPSNSRRKGNSRLRRLSQAIEKQLRYRCAVPFGPIIPNLIGWFGNVMRSSLRDTVSAMNISTLRLMGSSAAIVTAP